mgnify:CR=1 FL=1
MPEKELKIKAKILYVDDESINLRLFKISFKSDYVIQTSPSGEDALELLNTNERFDIIVSDQRMPGLTGTEFMIKAKKILPNCKFILLTGYTDIEALEKAINDVGIWQYVKKPWEPSNLKFIINNAFSNLQAEKENIIISSALQKSEERLNLALTGTNVGVWDWDLETNEMYFSPAWKEMLGYENDELENKLQTWENLLHKDDLQKYFTNLNNYITGENETYEIEFKLKHKNGQFIHILSRARGNKNESDEYIRLTGTNIDLTEKIKAQKQIKELNEELEERVERRTHALKLLNIQLIQRNKFEHLISKISSELVGIQTADLDLQIKVALDDILEFSTAQNSFVFSIIHGDFTLDHETFKGQEFSSIQKLIHKKTKQDLPLIYSKLKTFEPIVIKDTQLINDEFEKERDAFQQNKIESILIIPLLLNRNLKGGLGISFSDQKKDWNQEDINLLRFIGEIFTNTFERNQSEKSLIKRDKQLSKANTVISKNERNTKLLQNIASIANSPLQLKEALSLSQEIINKQSKGISSMLFKVNQNSDDNGFIIEKTIANTVQEEHNLRSLFLRENNDLKQVLDKTLSEFTPQVENNIKLNYNPDVLISYSFNFSTIPVIVENKMPYIFLTILPTSNDLLNDQNILKEISREISFVAERDFTKTELKKSLKKEKELVELKSQFISMASHQFRTPLTVIKANVDLFQMLADKIDVKLKEKFDKISTRIEDEATRLGDLMNDVLLLAKFDANVLSPVLIQNDVIKVINNLIDKLNEIQTDKRKATIQIENTIPEIYFDEKLFTHAFTNLLENAFKYSKETPSPIVNISVNNALIIEVIDFGRGIPKEDIKNLFQPFFRSNNTQGIEGTGLGLVVCKNYIELQKGSLEVESQENKKTIFRISLPINNHE